jgi:mono/diheme cytochrome c family protein
MPALAGIAVVYFGFLLLAGGSWTLDQPWYSSNPRMFVQPHVRSYQMTMPMPPQGALPRNQLVPPLPTSQAAVTLTTRPATAPQLAAAKTYYEYYCVSCHGDAGDGNGPVGESYVPKPSDLRSPRIRQYSDGQILRASLTGVGHEPVLEYVVLPEHRWYLVWYVKFLNSANIQPRPEQMHGAATEIH